MPMLLTWQTEVLAYQLADQPEAQEVMTNASKLADSAQVFAKTAEQLPALINEQRQAAIQQVLEGLSSQQIQMQDLMTNARAAFNAGAQMAQSVNDATKALEAFVRLVSPTNTNQTTSITNSRSFDVLDYGKAAAQIGDASRELNTLLTNLNATTPRLAELSQQTQVHADDVVRHATWSGIFLVTFFLIGSVLAAVLYRIICFKWLDFNKKRLDNLEGSGVVSKQQEIIDPPAKK
jgi:DNA repair ATPase RecN